MTRRALLLVPLLALLSIGCEDKAQVSIAHATEHLKELVKTSAEDVAEVRRGLPAGAKLFAPLWQAKSPPSEDLEAVRDALERTRGKVQDLRVAKSTFFALTDTSGSVLRNDQEQDLMTGKRVFDAFPELRKAFEQRKYIETRGSMKEAAGVAAPKVDGQWVAAAPVSVDGEPKGLYVTGWSWSSYAYRLEFALRSKIRSALLEQQGNVNEPLVYVFVLVGPAVYGAPVSPPVNLEVIQKLDPVSKLSGQAVFSQALDITGRDFGLSVQRAPVLGDGVALAVLRSET